MNIDSRLEFTAWFSWDSQNKRLASHDLFLELRARMDHTDNRTEFGVCLSCAATGRIPRHPIWLALRAVSEESLDGDSMHG